jgi:hypothetical protein
MERTGEPASSLEAKWKRSRQLAEIGNRLGASYPELELALDLETDVLLGPIRTMQDAIAKLDAIRLAFADGARADGADARAVCQTIQWLQMHCGEDEAKRSRAA